MKFILTILFITSIIGTAHSAEKIPFRVCKIDKDFIPFINMKGTGIWQKKIKKAIKVLPLELQFHDAPRRRCFLEAEQNSATDAVVIGYRVNYLSYPMKNATETDRDAGLGVVSLVVVVHKDSKIKWNGERFENLGDEIVGSQLGYLVNEKLDSMGVHNEEVPTAEKNIEKINKGRIEVAIMAREDFLLLKKKNHLKNVVALPIPFQENDVYLGVSTPYYQKNKKYVDAIWANLKKNK
ncbi:MAG: hypothetical protein PHY93_04795 [Bacteriovorax sp.]|nr:hypothetical protein [Bacteriovorax sp.]